MNMLFNEYLKSLRKNKKLTQIQLAEKSGVSKTHISRIETESDSAPKPETLKKLAPALDVNFEHLMYMAGYYENTAENELINQLELSDENLMEKFTFVYEGKPLSDIEVRSMLAFLKTNRKMNQ